MKLDIDRTLVWVGDICFWAVAVLAFAAFCGCGPLDEPFNLNGFVKGSLIGAAFFALVFGGETKGFAEFTALWLQVLRVFFILSAFTLAVLLPACGGGLIEEQWRAPPPCYVVLITDCADGNTYAPLCRSGLDCVLTAEETASQFGCETFDMFEPLMSCEGISEEGCERIAERCW